MEIYFNELSINNMSEITHEQIKAMTDSYKELRNNGVNTCRIGMAEHNYMIQMLKDTPDKRNVFNFYLSFFKTPFESEAVEMNQDEYFDNTCMYNNLECVGPAMAYILESVCFSIYHQEWSDSVFCIFKNEESVQIHNVSVGEHVRNHSEIFEKKKPVELIESCYGYADKEIDLRDDHGKDVLLEFSKKIIKSPYVDSVVNSLPFNPHDRKFIKKVHENGIIEIVLIWTDRKYGIAVQTTGRNIRETEKIAEILEEKYGYI